MSIQSLKIELVKEILAEESEEVLREVLQLLMKKDSETNLSEAELEEVKIAREQVEKGMVSDWESVYERLIKRNTVNGKSVFL